MVLKRTAYPFILSLVLAGGLFEPQAIRAANEPAQTTQTPQEEDSLQKKWRKKKKKKPSIAASWKKVINFDWDQLDSHDEKNLIISTLATGFVLSCLYMLRPVSIQPPAKTTPNPPKPKKSVIPTPHKKVVSGQPANNHTPVVTHNTAQTSPAPAVVTPQQPAQAPVYTHAHNAIQNKRAFQIKAFETTQDGELTTQQPTGNYLCGLYATHNALTVMNALTRNNNANLFDLEQAIINNQTTLRARLDTQPTSPNPKENWVHTVTIKRKITVAKHYLEYLFKNNIMQRPEIRAKLTWSQKLFFDWLGDTSPLTDKNSQVALPSNEMTALRILAEIVATDMAKGTPMVLGQFGTQWQQKYDSLNPLHQQENWYARRIQDIQSILDRIHNSITQAQIDDSFWFKAESYTKKNAPADSTDLSGNNFDSGEILDTLQALDQHYATAELSAADNSPADGRISVLDAIPNTSDHTINNIKRQMSDADTFCHGFVIRTGGAALQTKKSQQELNTVTQKRVTIEQKHHDNADLQLLSVILTALEKGRITSVDDATILQTNYAALIKNNIEFADAFNDFDAFQGFITTYHEDLHDFMNVIARFDQVTAQANVQLQAQASGYSTHWISCVMYKPTRESAPRYYILDSMNRATSASPTIQRLFELLESPIQNPS